MKNEASQGSIQTTLAPRKKRDKSLKSRMRRATPPKAKKIEDVGIILNRVVRAKCCLQPQNPERMNVMMRAVGDGSDYMQFPKWKAARIRYKFLSNNFLQGVNEDFMSCQNLERILDEVIILSPDLFKMYEIYDSEE